MAQHHLEVERKYENIDPLANPQEIDWTKLKDFVPQPPVNEELSATYFDTPAGDLGRNMVALRRRIGGYDQGWHIKFDDRSGSRHEVHYPLLSDPLKMPTAVTKFIRSAVLDEQIVETVSIHTQRTRTVLTEATGTPVAEVCQDRVQAVDFSTGLERSWNEWEVELKEAGSEHANEVFAQAEELLAQAGIAPSTLNAKIARALGKDPAFEFKLAGKKPQVAEKKAQKTLKKLHQETQKPADQLTSTHDVLKKLLLGLNADLTLWELKVRAEVPGAVHGMRITARQLSALLTFGVRPYTNTEDNIETIEAAEKDLKILLTGLSGARAMDIVGDFVAKVQTTPAIVGESTLTDLRELQALDAESSLRAVHRLLDSDEYLQTRKLLDVLTHNVERMTNLPRNTENYLNKIAKRLRKSLSIFFSNDFKEMWKLDPTEFAYDVNNNNLLFIIRQRAQSAKHILDLLQTTDIPFTGDQNALHSLAEQLHRELGLLSDEQVIIEWLESAARKASQQQKDRLGVGYLLGRSSYYAVGLRMTDHSFVPGEIKRIKKLTLR